MTEGNAATVLDSDSSGSSTIGDAISTIVGTASDSDAGVVSTYY